MFASERNLSPVLAVALVAGEMVPMVAFLATLLAAGMGAEDLNMRFMPVGASAKAGVPSRSPIFRVELNENARLVKKAPQGLTAPKYGAIAIGDRSWAVILDKPGGKSAMLFVDTNADGDLTNDPKASWTAETEDGSARYIGKVEVDLRDGRRGSLLLVYVNADAVDSSDSADDSRHARPKEVLLCRPDYGYEITVKLDDKEFMSVVCGPPSVNSALWIDRDDNQRRSSKYEFVYVGKPFNFTGTTYVLELKGDKFVLQQADMPLPLTPPAPDLRIGKQAPPFMMEAMDGRTIDFPNSYAGKLVMLDFWATWCAPCVAELPNVKQAYETWHDKGFEVLGISSDPKDKADELAAFTKENDLPWPQIHDGRQKEEKMLAELYDVRGIPFVLLIDGDSGEIVGTSQELRGPGLSDFVGKALMKKSNSPN